VRHGENIGKVMYKIEEWRKEVRRDRRIDLAGKMLPSLSRKWMSMYRQGIVCA